MMDTDVINRHVIDMLRRLADENFNGDIVRALLLRQPDLDQR